MIFPIFEKMLFECSLFPHSTSSQYPSRSLVFVHMGRRQFVEVEVAEPKPYDRLGSFLGEPLAPERFRDPISYFCPMELTFNGQSYAPDEFHTGTQSNAKDDFNPVPKTLMGSKPGLYQKSRP